MNKLTNEELLLVTGGALSSSLINSISKIAGTIFDLGRAFGSSVRRIIGGSFCQI